MTGTSSPEMSLARDLVVVNELGLHARCAAIVAQRAQQAWGKVSLTKNGLVVDASSLLDILSLACGKGGRITLKVTDSRDINILNEIAALIESGFEE
ncbi:HPr family phosphocarrier protein [Thermodesulfobacteriota bacterium]